MGEAVEDGAEIAVVVEAETVVVEASTLVLSVLSAGVGVVVVVDTGCVIDGEGGGRRGSCSSGA